MAHPPELDFSRQDLPDFFLCHVKNSLILLFRSCGVPSIKEFMYNGTCLKIPVRVTLIGWGTRYRRRRFSSFGKQQYDEVFWDIPLLFGKKTFDKFAVVGQEKNKLNRLNIEIDSFEKQLEIILPASKQVIITSQISVAKINKEYSFLESSIKGILEGFTNNELALNSVDEYVECLKQADDLQRIVDAKTIQLVLELNEFTRKSIQQEEERNTQ